MSTNTKKAKSAGYRPGSNYDQLFQVGASKLHTKEELIYRRIRRCVLQAIEGILAKQNT